jgi:hypothetical protein
VFLMYQIITRFRPKWPILLSQGAFLNAPIHSPSALSSPSSPFEDITKKRGIYAG